MWMSEEYPLIRLSGWEVSGEDRGGSQVVSRRRRRVRRSGGKAVLSEQTLLRVSCICFEPSDVGSQHTVTRNFIHGRGGPSSEGRARKKKEGGRGGEIYYLSIKPWKIVRIQNDIHSAICSCWMKSFHQVESLRTLLVLFKNSYGKKT